MFPRTSSTVSSPNPPSPEELSKLSLSSFEKVGITGKIFSTFGLTAKTEFVLVEDQKETCAKGDLVVIPSGKKFTYKGNLKLLLIVTPPWKEEQEETVLDNG